MMETLHYDRYLGALIGLAVGDALGTALERRPPGTFAPVKGMLGGGPYGLRPGEWSGDTASAMCLAESLIARRGFDERDQIDRYRQWYRAGYWSCRDACFDIGDTVRSAVESYENNRHGGCRPPDVDCTSSDSLARLAPIPLYFARTPEAAIKRARDSSRITHGAVPCLDACRCYSGLVLGALRGIDKTDLLSGDFTVVAGLWQREPLCGSIAAVAAGSYRHRQPPEIRGSKDVVQAMEAALWAFHNSDSFREGALMAVNLGDNASGTGAIYGQLAGACYGCFNIPEEWTSCLAWRKQIGRLARHLYGAAATR